MRKLFSIILSVITLLISLISCDDSTVELGQTVVPSIDVVAVDADTFNVSTCTVVVDSVIAQNGFAYLGRLRDAETDAYITSNFITQYSILEGMEFDDSANIASRDDFGRVCSDTSLVCFYIDDWYGDTLNQMQLTAYELAKPLDEDRIYYTNFDVEKSGYVRPASEGGIQKTLTWTIRDMSESDSIVAETYGRRIVLPLNEPYKAKDGVTYKNLSSYIFKMALDHPEYFKNSYTFNKYVFPGFYIKSTNSIGSMVGIMLTDLMIYYKYQVNEDSISKRWVTLYGTDEVLQLSKIENDAEVLSNLAKDSSYTYLKTPANLFTEMTLPIESIFESHERDTINTASITLQKINNTYSGEYALEAPDNLLMIEKDSIESFFELNNVADGEHCFISTSNSTLNTYSFDNISALVTLMYQQMKSGTKNDPLWKEKHPNWNKVMIIPVSVTYNSSGSMTDVEHDMTMKSVRIVGGLNNPKVRINVVYSKFNSNN